MRICAEDHGSWSVGSISRSQTAIWPSLHALGVLEPEGVKVGVEGVLKRKEEKAHLPLGPW